MTDPIHILSLGAGVQSSTLALMAAWGEVPGLPIPTAAIFADTQDEPASVYRWLDQLIGFINAAPYPFPVHIVSRGRLSESTLKMRVSKKGGLFSSTDVPFFTKNDDGVAGKITNRGCTFDFKISPILKKARELGAVPRKKKEGNRVHVVQWIGISLDEIYRMKPSRDWWAESIWPLVDLRMNRHDCKRWMQDAGYPEPPRSSCVYCPYHNNHEWRRLRDEEPEEFAKAIEFERNLQETKSATSNFKSTPFLHRSLVPLDQVDLSTDEDRGQGMLSFFNNECEGICGV
jgi:hypothetical protein